MKNWNQKVSLAKFTTFQIGGFAEYFLEVKNIEDLISAIKLAKEKSLPVFILGGGSNILVNDNGFPGLVIKLTNDYVDKSENGILKIGAGTFLSKVVVESMKNNLTGMEWAIAIPGTIGGAVNGNCGAYGSDISCSVLEVEVLNLSTLQIEKIPRENCDFKYRESIFKNNRDKIIISVKIKLNSDNEKNIKEKMNQYLSQRTGKIPPFPSAGSVFKNMEVTENNKHILDLIPKDKIKGTKIPVGYLIEECGLKGLKIGGAQISEQHANFIVNINNAKAKDVLELIALCKSKIKEKFKIDLEEEIVFVGF